MNQNQKKLSSTQMSILQEIGNIGSAHAALSLSQMMKTKIMVAVPSIKVGVLDDLLKSYQFPQETALYFKVLGQAQGGIIFMMSDESTVNLASVLLDKDIRSVEHLSDLEVSSIKEVGNILSSAYLTAISDFLNMVLIPSVPHLIHAENRDSFLSDFKLDLNKEDLAIGIDAEFIEASAKIKGNFIFMPDEEGLKTLFKVFGIS